MAKPSGDYTPLGGFVSIGHSIGQRHEPQKQTTDRTFNQPRSFADAEQSRRTVSRIAATAQAGPRTRKESRTKRKRGSQRHHPKAREMTVEDHPGPWLLSSKPTWATVWHLWRVIIPRRSITGRLVYGRVLRRHDGRRWLYKKLVETSQK